MLLKLIARHLRVMCSDTAFEEHHASLGIGEMSTSEGLAKDGMPSEPLIPHPCAHAEMEAQPTDGRVDLDDFLGWDEQLAHADGAHSIGPVTARVRVPSIKLEIPASDGAHDSRMAENLQSWLIGAGNSITHSSVFPASS